jgi:putative transcriptional regulator
MRNTMRVQRAIKEITQEELANALNVARQSINAIELRKFVPSVKLALQMADYFKIPVDQLFYLEEHEKIKEPGAENNS